MSVAPVSYERLVEVLKNSGKGKWVTELNL